MKNSPLRASPPGTFTFDQRCRAPMSLALVHARQVACWPWGLSWLDGSDDVQFATCRTCERDVAQPKARAKDVPVCLYCALDSGLLPELEVQIGGPLP